MTTRTWTATLFAVVSLSALGALPTRAQITGDPQLTPMTIRPSLINAAEVREALLRSYPAQLRDAGIEGTAFVFVHIGTSGVVDDARVAEGAGSGYEGLDRAALDVARVMRFSPARDDADAVIAAWVQLPIRFQVVR